MSPDQPSGTGPEELVRRLRSAGCVFAEEEAAVLTGTEPDPRRRELLVRRREAGEPLEHLVGTVEFGGLRLAVGPGVFVPRQRSLLLAGLAVRRARDQPRPVLLEVCAGVAPVAAAAARAVPGLEVHAADIDQVALGFARRNLPAGAGIHVGHLLDAVPACLAGRITVLVAVPPYVPVRAAHMLPREARDHEPGRALYGGQDGLDHVRELIDRAGSWLAPAGRLLVELSAHQQQAAADHARRAGVTRHERHSDRQGTVVLELAWS